MDTISNAALENVTGGGFMSDAGDVLANSAFGAGLGTAAGAAASYFRTAAPHLSRAETRGLTAYSGAKWGAAIAAGATIATKAYNALTK